MNIDELCELCKKYLANKIKIIYKAGQLECYSDFSEDSVAIKEIKASIEYCEMQNKEIELKIRNIVNIS